MSELHDNKHFLIADSRCFEQKLTVIELAVYMRICMRAHKSVCFESAQHIADACNVSYRSVTMAFSKLRSLNMMEIHSGKKAGGTNHIKLIPYENWIKIDNGVGTTCLPTRHHLPTHSAPPAYPLGTTCLHNSTRVNSTNKQDSLYVAPAREQIDTRVNSTNKQDSLYVAPAREQIDTRVKKIGISLATAICRAHRRRFFDFEVATTIVTDILATNSIDIDILIDIIDEIDRESFLTSLKPADIVSAIVNRPASKQAKISTIVSQHISLPAEPSKIEEKPNLPISKPKYNFAQKIDTSNFPSNFNTWISALPRREQIALGREIENLGVDIFLTHRLPALHGYRYAPAG